MHEPRMMVVFRDGKAFLDFAEPVTSVPMEALARELTAQGAALIWQSVRELVRQQPPASVQARVDEPPATEVQELADRIVLERPNRQALAIVVLLDETPEGHILVEYAQRGGNARTTNGARLALRFAEHFPKLLSALGRDVVGTDFTLVDTATGPRGQA